MHIGMLHKAKICARGTPPFGGSPLIGAFFLDDLDRRMARSGLIYERFMDDILVLAPDGLSPVGGYPGNDDDGRTLQRRLDRPKLRRDMVNGARYLKAHALSNGRLGATGFCWGGGVTNFLAVTLGGDLNAAAPFYGRAPDPAEVSRIRAPLLIHYAENDPRVNAMRPAFEAALKANNADYRMHTYPGTRHGFHNNSTPRYDQAAAKLAWRRSMKFFKRHLA